MSQKISESLGMRYCGIHLGRCAMYNDDNVTGGSFVVPIIHDALDVAAALDAKRAEFRAYKKGTHHANA